MEPGAVRLLPAALINLPQAEAVEEATAAIDTFRDIYQAEWSKAFRAKIARHRGRRRPAPDRAPRRHHGHPTGRFTRTFRGLADGTARDEFADRDAFGAWETDWQAACPAKRATRRR